MKKLVLFFAVATAVAFASCAPKATEATEEATDSTVVVEAPVADSVVVADSVAAPVVK